jgi:hypothetical protein
MTVVVDIIGPNTANNFGPEGLYAIGDKVAFQTPADSIYAKLGPAVVSWSGKLVQVMLLIEPTATSRTITLLLKNGAAQTPFNFTIATPQNIPVQNAGGVLGGNIGSRTSRNVMIVDSLILRNGTYTVSAADLSLGQPGNQAYLPLRILSKGPIRLENATLSVRGKHGSEGSHGGPGGGGGGGGALRSGGDGFTGGGGVGPAPRFGGVGTGPASTLQPYHGGSSMNGTLGGFGTEYGNSSADNDEGGGGGTGHPFGTSGWHGLYGANSPAGGYGAGSGGGQGSAPPLSVTYGGGGGGYATKGAQGGGNGDNGGHEVGNKMLVPFAGGSGGGSGNIWYSSGPTGHGGGGGGAAEITSFKGVEVITSIVDASGGIGSNGTNNGPLDFQHGSGGGGGSGGAIDLVARDSINIRSTASSAILNVAGGGGGTGYNSGGAGGRGRIRLDGRVSWVNGFNTSIQYYDPAYDYVGPVISKVDTFNKRIRISGYAAGWEGNNLGGVQVSYRTATTGWQTTLVATGIEAGSRTGAWSIDVDRPVDIFDTTIYVIAMQRNTVFTTTPYTSEPAWVMSHASGIISGLPGVPRIAVLEDTIDFGKLRVGICKDSTIIVRSTGSAQLEVTGIGLEGDVSQFVLRTTGTLQLPPSTQGDVDISFCPKDTGCFESLVRIKSNDTERVVRLLGCGIRPEILTLSEIDFGPVRVGTCKDTTFTVSNPGNDTLTITSEVFTNTNFSAIAPILPVKIAPRGSAQFTLRYCPGGNAAETGYDTIKSDATIANWPIKLLGRGTQGILAVIDTLDFGEVLVGACKDSFITVTNIGDDTVFVNTAPIFTSFFSVLSGQLPIVLAPSESDTLYIRFCPIDEVAYISSDSVRADAPTAAREIVVKGKGIKGLLSVPNAIDHECVVIGESILDTLVIGNIGTARVTGITTNSSPAELTVVRAAQATLDPTKTDSIIVRFTPTTPGEFRGEVRLGSDGLPALQIPYTARVTVAPTLEYSRRRVDYDTVLEGTTKTECVTVMNPSCKSITINTAQLALAEEAFSIEPKLLPVTLSDSATFEFCVTANSNLSGIFIDTLVFVTDRGRFADVVLDARVETIKLKLEPAMLDFGTVLARVPPPSQQARLINISSQPAKITTPGIQGPDANQFTYTGGVTILQPGDTAFYDVSYLASVAGSHTGYFVAYTGEKFDSVLLIGTALPNIDTIDAIVHADTMGVRAGDVIALPVRVTDITAGEATTATFRVQFDPMRVDLRDIVMEGSIFKTATLVKHSLGDWSVTVSDPDTADGAGIMAKLRMEILAGVQNEVPVRLSEVSFPNSITRVLEANDGLLLIQECDTTEDIRMGQLSDVAAIHPNPAHDKITIPVTLYRDASVSVVLYNTLGQIVRDVPPVQMKTGANIIHLDLQALPQSTYIYEVRCTDRENTESHRGNLNIE